MMLRSITASALGLLVLAAGEPVPSINPEPSCRSAAARTEPIGDIEVCMRKEREARDVLVKRWGEFNASDKATCIPLATAGGTATYTELLSCLEVKRDARLLRERRSRNDGAGSSPMSLSLSARRISSKEFCPDGYQYVGLPLAIQESPPSRIKESSQC